MSSYFVRPRANGKWVIFEEIWSDNKRSQPKVIPQSYPSLGVNPAWSLEQVKARIVQINKEKRLDRKAATQIARRLAELDEYDKVFFPEDLVTAFLENVKENTAGSDDYFVRLVGGFKFVQKMMLSLKLQPHQYEKRKGAIYSYFNDAKISVDYSQEILKMLNNWGMYVSEERGSFYRPVPKIPKTFRRNIAKAQKKKTGVRRESDQLTPEILLKLQSHLATEEYNWVFTAFWFGLRPSEVDAINGSPEVITHRSKKFKMLEVLQEKIESDDEDESYKYIPIFRDEQKKAVELLKEGNLKRPTPKKLKEITGENVDTYSPRKGFADLMKDLGQDEMDVSVWLGHKSIATTRKHYMDPQNISFTEVSSESHR